MSIGILVGVGLLVGCETKRAQRYTVTAHSLTAGGIAILFSTFYASYATWHLVPSWMAFMLLVLVTAVAVVLSIRRDSVYIALLGLLGGFLTPILLSEHKDNPLGLFGYLTVLNVGLAWVAYRKRWAVLSAIALGFTALYQFGWVMRFLDESKLGIGLGVFLLFPVLAFGSLILAQWKERDEVPPLFRKATALTGIPPLLFALHIAATPAYGGHYAMMLGFLFLVVAGLAAIALFKGPEWLHLLGAVSVLVIFASWLGSSYTHEAWPAVLGFTALFAGLLLLVPWLQFRFERLIVFENAGRYAVFAAPLLLFVFPVLVLLEPSAAAPGPLFGALLGLMVLLAAYAIRFEDGFVHFTACFFVLVTEALWSSRFLSAERLLPALLVYGGFGLFYLGVPLLAERKGRRLRPEGSGAILAFASLALLFFLSVGPIAATSLWALAVLVGVLNLGLLYEASCGHFPVLSILGMILSWILLAVWWFSAPIAALMIPALIVMGGFGLLVVGGSLWLKARGKESTTVSSPGIFLGLAGHLFLLVVAAQPRLASPPWSWLAVLLVLDLALGVAALYLKRGAVLVGATLLTQVILMSWFGTSAEGTLAHQFGPWISLGFAILGYLWFEAARRRGAEEMAFRFSAGLGLVLAQLLLIVTLAHPLAHGSFVSLNLLLALGLLLLAWRSGRQAWALVLVFSAGLVVFSWMGKHPPLRWQELLSLATPLYLLQLIYPLLRGQRAEQERLPFYSAVLASGIYFFFGRVVFVQAGWREAIGLLPVLQALLLTPHLLRLVKREPRDLGRVALVAGAILAFITVAIPLQLEKEWITLGWALLGAALAWLYGRVPHKGLLAWCGGLLAVVFARLVLNPAVFDYHTRSEVPVFNWYFYTYLVAAACYFVAAWLLKETDDELFSGAPALSKVLPAGGAVVLFLLLNIEIADVFSSGPALTFNLLHGSLAQDLSYTIGWAVYAIGLLIAGIAAHSRVTRVAAILLLTVTIFKAFFHDLSRLEGLYRVASFVGLAMSLALVAVILQKFVLHKSEEPS